MLFSLADLHSAHRALRFGFSRVDLAGVAHDTIVVVVGRSFTIVQRFVVVSCTM